MINQRIKTAALFCPTGKVIPLSQSCHTESTVRVLKQLQLKLDRALKQQYAQQAKAALSQKTNKKNKTTREESFHSTSRFTR